MTIKHLYTAFYLIVLVSFVHGQVGIGVVSPDVAHSHDYYDKTVSREDVNDSKLDNQGINVVPDNLRTTDSGGARTSAFSTSNCTGCSGTAHENKPSFYALACIMKL